MILLKNGTYIDWKTLDILPSDIRVGSGPAGSIELLPAGSIAGTTGIRNTETQSGAVDGQVRVIDCSGKFITRAFANGHHHAYSALSAGMPFPTNPPGSFREMLQTVWWTLDKALDLDLIRLSALVTAMASARYGVTFVMDHHASPNCIDGSLEIIAAAFERVGISHLLCYEISDRDGLELADKGLDETKSYLQNHQGLVGLHASFTVGPATLKNAVRLALEHHSGIHVHVAEDIYDQQHCRATYGIRVVERLEKEGILDMPKTLLAHALHLDRNERDLIRRSPAWVVENMESNLNNSVGIFDGAGLSDRIMLGTDGMHSEMLRSARAAFLGGKLQRRPDGKPEAPDLLSPLPGLTSSQIIYQRLRNVHHYLHAAGFTGDGENNLIIFDNKSPTPVTTSNVIDHLLFGTLPQTISHVISDGKLIVEDNRITTVDEPLLLQESRKEATRLWKRIKSLR